MKKISFLVLVICFFFSPVFASSITLEQFLHAYFTVVSDSLYIPDSASSIRVNYTNISEKDTLYPFLQKLIYLDIFPNFHTPLPLSKPITQKQATFIVHQGFGDIRIEENQDFVSLERLNSLLLNVKHQTLSSLPKSSNTISQPDLYTDVLSRLKSSYYYQTGLNMTGLLYGAVHGLVDSLDDPYTSFFPPTEADSFTDQLEGQFYGIGAYVEMTEPGVFLITATIDGTPAQKAGLRAGDRIIQVDDHIIDTQTSSSQAVTWIKGPSGTTVSIKYLRDGKSFTIDVVRSKIIIPNIESKVYTGGKLPICILTLRMFDLGVSNQFSKIMGQFSHDTCSKYIFDLRNNPGGSLQEVTDMLNYFVPTGDSIISVKSRMAEEKHFALGSKFPKLTGEIIRILINGGSASASEIFAGVVREYVPNSLLVGQKTYGKGSVQSLISYDDGSLLKYTIAKRYTGKKDINIDKIGFTPDVKIDDLVGTGKDAILDWALKN